MKHVQLAVNGSFGAIAGSFLIESIHQMITWFLVMFAVITCDLCFGVRKSILMGEAVRISRAFRDTMGKIVTYFSFVVMVVMVSKASGNDKITLWSILFVCAIEGLSIVGNILKPKGYDINLSVVVSAIAKKLFGIDKEDTEGLITKTKEDETKR